MGKITSRVANNPWRVTLAILAVSTLIWGESALSAALLPFQVLFLLGMILTFGSNVFKFLKNMIAGNLSRNDYQAISFWLLVIIVILVAANFKTPIQFDLSEKNITAYRNTWWGLKTEHFMVKLINDQWHIQYEEGKWEPIEYDSDLGPDEEEPSPSYKY